MSDFDYDEIDEAINDILEQEDHRDHQPKPSAKSTPVNSKSATKSTVRPNPTSKPSPKPASAKPTTSQPTASSDIPHQNGRYIDIIPTSQTSNQPVAPSFTRTETKVIEESTPDTSFISEEIITLTATPDQDEDDLDLLAGADFIEEPEPLGITDISAFASDQPAQSHRISTQPVDDRSASTTTESARSASPYRPEPRPFIQNLKVEKRPLSNNLPKDHNANVISTRNAYASPSFNAKGKASQKFLKSKHQKKSSGPSFIFIFIIVLIIILGAIAGFLLFLLLAG